MKPNRTPEQGQELLPLACGGCGRCPFCTTRAVFLWTLTSGKIDQWGSWKAAHARARSKSDSGVSGDPGVGVCLLTHDPVEAWGKTVLQYLERDEVSALSEPVKALTAARARARGES